MLYTAGPAMHVPDGFLSTFVAIALWLISLLVVSVSLRRVGPELGERQVPLMGVLAAAIFAGQMLNFTVAGGTSGHLLGAALATILLGPWPALVVMTSVVSVQAIVFQDGGLVALGANLFNMAVVGVAVSAFVFDAIRGITRAGRPSMLVGAGTAAWFSIEAAAVACALELSVSGTSPATVAIPAMAGIHALIGLGEALITVGAIGFIMAARPDLLFPNLAPRGGNIAVLIAGAVLTVGLAAAAPLASSRPDGLEWVAAQQGFIGRTVGSLYTAMPDYIVPGIANTGVATQVAAILGSITVLGATLAAAHLRRPRRGP